MKKIGLFIVALALGQETLPKNFPIFHAIFLFFQTIPYNMTSMDFGSNLDGSGTFVSPYWPLVVAHRIDQGSPLYSLAPRDMQTQHFEVAL